MESLVLANLKHRPTRVTVTTAGVAIGTILLLLIVGLMHGMLKERGTREANVAAEIIVRPPGSFANLGVGSNSLTLPVEIADKVRQLPGVKSVTPIGSYLQNTDSGIGFRAVDGIEFDSYQATSGIELVVGHPPTSDEEVIIDEDYAERHRLQPGASVEVLEKKFKVAAVFRPQVSTRIKVRLSVLQAMQAAEGRCSLLLVRCNTPADQEKVAAGITANIPEMQIIFTRDLPRLYSEGLPVFNVFVRVLVSFAIFISILVVLLAMYTAITERTREIGILKSLGASRSFIIWAIEKEALLIGAMGVLAGYIIAFTARFFIIKFTTIRFIEFEPEWIITSALIGLGSGLVGALYPALRAASQDPVEALSYE